MKYLLDTNICIYLINHRPERVLQHFYQHKIGDIAISAITASELAFGVEKTGSARNRRALEKFFLPLEILPFDDRAIWHYGKLRADLQRKGTPIGSLDMLIAAHALSLSMTLVTNNTKEFSRIANLTLENWV